MPKVYIASGIANWRLVQDIQEKLIEEGIDIPHDWASIAAKEEEGVEPPDDLSSIQVKTASSVDCLLFITPGGRGAHVEFGSALACGVPCVVFLQVRPIGFYRLGLLTDSLEEAIKHTVKFAFNRSEPV